MPISGIQPGGNSLASSLIAPTTKGSESPSGTFVVDSGSESGTFVISPGSETGTFVMDSGTYVVNSGTYVSSGSATGTSVGTSVQGSSDSADFLSDVLKSLEPRFIAPATLEQRQAWPTDPSPVLVRQARYGALSSVTKLLPSDAIPREAVQAKSLPTVDQLIARAGPIKTPTFLERVQSLFRRDTASGNYEKMLTMLARYHDVSSWIGAENHAVMTYRLDEVAKAVDQYAQSGLHGEMIADLRQQLLGERGALEKLQAGLKEGFVLPEGASFSHALAFTREGISLKDMARLIDKGLELDQIPEALDILEAERTSPAYQKLPDGYRKILVDLDHYQTASTAPELGESGQTSTAKAVEDAVKLLENLQASTEKYLQAGNAPSPSDPHTQALQDLRDQIPLEHRVLSDLLSELKTGIPLPEKAQLPQVLAFAREGIRLEDMARFLASGSSPAQAREQLDIERGNRLTEQLTKMDPAQKQLLLDDFTESEIVLLETSGLGIDGGKAYRLLDLPITPQTIVRTKEQEVGAMLALGAGACNTVYAARYSTPEGIVQGVFKPLTNTETAGVAMALGIDRELPQIANRNLATQDVARALGFNVVVDCQIGSRQQPDKPVELGLIMGRAPGKEAYATHPGVFKQPEVRREITKLQLLDHLVGQADRHGHNYFVHVSQDENGRTQARVSGIDNDLCFGQTTRHGDQIAYDGYHDVGYRGTKMPELIDTDMADAIRRLTPQQLNELLSDKLSPLEVSAAHSRLASMLEHVDRLENSGQVITPAEWNARAEIDTLHQPDNSYVGRDAETATELLKLQSSDHAERNAVVT